MFTFLQIQKYYVIHKNKYRSYESSENYLLFHNIYRKDVTYIIIDKILFLFILKYKILHFTTKTYYLVAEYPPSITCAVPVIKDASSLRRKHAKAATSSGVPYRPKAVPDAIKD